MAHYKLVSIMKEHGWDVNEFESLTPLEMGIYRAILIDELRKKAEKANE